ncbi:MAG: PAAR domain-containing protein [Pseudomonas sp.]|uniref:PAAR domain-containing protein n=1 Tax=Pseudomonas sp. TaxID=306 RepID=UPI003D6EB518
MSEAFVLLGDPTTHGGVVISASSTHTVAGKTVALVGDLVACPLPGHGVNPIVQGCQGWEEGRALVVNGCLAACGCLVMATTSECSSD